MDLFKSLPGLRFADAWSRRSVDTWGGVPLSVLGRADLIAAKRPAGRPPDQLAVPPLDAAAVPPPPVPGRN